MCDYREISKKFDKLNLLDRLDEKQNIVEMLVEWEIRYLLLMFIIYKGRKGLSEGHIRKGRIKEDCVGQGTYNTIRFSQFFFFEIKHTLFVC